MIKISRSEKKLINVTLITVIGITVFLVFFYIPKSAALARQKSKVEKSDALLAEVRKFIGEYASLDQGVRILRKQAVFLSGKLIDQSDISVSLNRLSEAADTAGVRIVSISPQAISVFGAKGGSATYYDKACLKQPIRLLLEGRYEQLVNYLYLLEYSPIGIYTINGFNITKDINIYPDLKMELVAGLFVFGGAKK